MENLRITLVQTNLKWEDAAGNRRMFESYFKEIESTDLIVLPEMFTTGFSMRSGDLAEEMTGSSVTWMKQQAKMHNTVICGSLIIKADEDFYNRQLWVTPNGDVQHYDKRHLFRMAEENEYFSAGEKKLLVELKGWKIMPLICYDLRFPTWSRNRFKTDRKTYASPEYDVLLYNANWPEARVNAWRKLLAARAIENQSYVIGVNRVGEDGKGIAYSGGSQAIDAKGDVIWEAEDHAVDIHTVSLKADDLRRFREKFPVGMDGDEFELKN